MADTAGDPMKDAPRLAGQQVVLYERLVDRDDAGQLAAIYLGAVRSLQHVGNPDHCAQAAHSARELMEKLPRIGQGDPDRGTMKEEARKLENVWESYKQEVDFEPARLAGQPVDPPLLLVLQELDGFIGWTQRNTQSRSKQAELVIRELEVSSFVIPDEVRAASVKQWQSLRDFFDNASHHRFPTSAEQVAAQLGRLEEFLLDLWLPDTFGDFAELDQLMEATNGV